MGMTVILYPTQVQSMRTGLVYVFVASRTVLSKRDYMCQLLLVAVVVITIIVVV